MYFRPSLYSHFKMAFEIKSFVKKPGFFFSHPKPKKFKDYRCKKDKIYCGIACGIFKDKERGLCTSYS